jgi:hypothetical protein
MFPEFLFADNLLWVSVTPQAEKDGLTQLVVARPLGKLDLSDQDRFNPLTALNDRRGYALTPSATPLFR